jgi:hypothetical protein
MLDLEDLEARYLLFNDGDLDALVEYFRTDAVLVQTNTNQTATGHDQIRAVMAGWGTWFQNPYIEQVIATDAPDRLAEVEDAVQCATVTFTGTGRYVQTIPGLEGTAPANNAAVELPLTEVVWIDEAGNFLRVENTFEVAALN